MIRIRDTKHPHTSSLLDAAVRAAEFYGFNSLDAARTEKKAMPTVSDLEKTLSFARREEKSVLSAARRCLSAVRQGHEPLLFWKTGRGFSKTNTPYASLDLHIIGVPAAIAEALLIMVADGIAEDAGLPKRIVLLNSMGVSDSSNRYLRDIGTFLKKHIESIAPALRPRAVEDPLGTLIQLIDRGHPGTHRAPQPMEYLTEEERRRFWELLEYIEGFGLPYELNPHILGSREFWAHSLFELHMHDAETNSRIPIAWGGRYDPLSLRIAGSHTPSAMISIMFEQRGRMKVIQPRGTAPALFFAHLGNEARRRTMPVLEALRRANIPVRQAVMHERMGEQMALAQSMRAPYLLIMGHKEAVEGTVLFREVATNSQRAIPVQELPTYLRRHKAFA